MDLEEAGSSAATTNMSFCVACLQVHPGTHPSFCVAMAWTSSKPCLCQSHSLSIPAAGAVVQVEVKGATGQLLPRTAILCPGNKVHLWISPQMLSAASLANQSYQLPQNVGNFPMPSDGQGSRASVGGLLMTKRGQGWIMAPCANRPVQVLDPLRLQRAIA